MRFSKGVALITATVLVAAAGGSQIGAPPTAHGAETWPREVRALWVVRTSLTTPRAIETMVAEARDGGFNTLLVQIRGRGDAYYAESREPRAAALVGQPTFDPLAFAIAEARAAGLRVHAWVNVNLVSSARYLPPEPSHVIYRHPEWIMVPKDLGRSLARLDPQDPQYLQRLVQDARHRSNDLEGLYVSPLTAAAADYVADLARDVVSRYPVDGVHLDYVRYPSDAFDYSQAGLKAFHRVLAADLTDEERRQLDRRLTADPLAHTEQFPGRWRRFRQEQLTHLVVKVREAVKNARPEAVLSAAVVPDPAEAAERRLQDWRGWLALGVLDVVCPMIYTEDGPAFAEQVAAIRTTAGRTPVWAGIGAYRLSHSGIVANVHTARRLGAEGIVLFSYDSLTPPARSPAFLSAIGRAVFTD